MPDLAFPVSSTPGLLLGEGEGRLVNVFAEKSGSTVYWRPVPGLGSWVDTGRSCPRGMIEVAGTLFVAFADVVMQVAADGSLITHVGLPGTDPVTFARNNRTTNGILTPDIVIVRSAGGAYVLNPSTGIVAYPDGNLPALPTSVRFLGGYFLFTYTDGRIYASGTTATPTNTIEIDPLSFATAESSTDSLLRGIVFGGTFFAFGAESIEPWINQGLSPFPLLRATSVIPIGLLVPGALAGDEDGWGYSPFFVASDRTVRELTGYRTRVVSTPAVDAFINASDIASLEASVFTFRGRAHWALTSNVGTWVLDVVAGTWHERQSNGIPQWRASRSIKSNGRWIVGDRQSGKLLVVVEAGRTEVGVPLVCTLESGPLKQFPSRGTVWNLFLDFSPVANAFVDVTWSHDGGWSWQGDGEERALLPDNRPTNQIRINRLGEFSHHGLRVRLVVDDPIVFSFMGGSVGGLEQRAP